MNRDRSAHQAGPSPSLLVMVPMRVEAAILRRGISSAALLRTGVGPRRARISARKGATVGAQACAIAGFAGSLTGELEPGDVLVVDRLLRRDGACVTRCEGTELLVKLLSVRGLHAVSGPVVSVRSPVARGARRLLRDRGALAADMESVWLAPAAADRPLAVIRVIVDSPTHELTNPVRIISGFRRAAAGLRVAGGALEEWAAVVGAESSEESSEAARG